MKKTSHSRKAGPMSQQTASNSAHYPILQEMKTMKEATRAIKTLSTLVLCVALLVLAVKI